MYNRMKCPECSKEYSDKLKYCISCGTELVSADTVSEIIDVNETVNEVSCSEINGAVREFTDHKNISVTSNDCIIPDDNFEPQSVAIEMTVNNEPENTEDDLLETLPVTKTHLLKRLGLGTVSFGVSMLMLSFIILAVGSFVGRQITDEKQIDRFVKEADLLCLPVNEFSIIDKDKLNSDATVMDVICTITAGSGISKDNIQSIYNDSTIKSFIEENLNDYALFLRTGEKPQKLTSDSIKQIYSDNLWLINSVLGNELTQNDIELAYSEIEKTAPLLEKISDVEKSTSIISPIRLYISTPVLVIEIVLAAFMLVILFLVNKNARHAFKWCGAALIIAGCFVLCITFLSSIRIFTIGGTSEVLNSIMHSITEVISGNLYLVGICLAVGGLLFAVMPFGKVVKTA